MQHINLRCKLIKKFGVSCMFHKGQKIGSYKLLTKIGKGGFGEVWLAEKRSELVTKKVAVKLPLEDQVNLETIKQEAELWEQASGHANVLPIIDADIIDGQVLIVSEYAEGGSLHDKLRREGKLSIKQAVEMTIGILNGLEFLHNKRIIHRDIKPQNILLQGDTPRLADFGISRAMQTTAISSTIIGTDSYMSPETFEGKRSIQTDIWAVGVVLYQLLQGSLPFPQEHPSERMFAIIQKDFEPLPDEVPFKLQQIIKKALAKLPENRYAVTSEMCEELKEFLIISAPKPKTAPKTDFLPPKTQKEKIKPEIVTKIRPKTSSLKTKNLVKPTSNQLYFAIPAIAVLFFALIGGYWFLNQSSTETKLIPFRKGDKFGFSDVKKKIIIEPKYEIASEPHEGFIGVGIAKKYGFIDKTGKEVIPLKYDGAFWFSEGFALVNLNNKWGFIDKTGKEIIPLEFDNLTLFSDGLARVKLNDKYGFIDKTGNEVIQPKYNNASLFSEDLAFVELNNKWGIIDKTGKEVMPLKYNNALEFSEGLARVELNDKYGFIDKTGKEVIPIKYNYAHSFSDSLALVKLNDKYSFIDKKGSEVISLKYDSTYPFSEGFACVTLNNKWGFIDKTGKEVIALKYEHTSDFSEGLAAVQLNSNFFYINKNGTEYYEP